MFLCVCLPGTPHSKTSPHHVPKTPSQALMWWSPYGLLGRGRAPSDCGRQLLSTVLGIQYLFEDRSSVVQNWNRQHWSVYDRLLERLVWACFYLMRPELA